MWTGKPVSEEIAVRFQVSLQIALMSTLFAVILSIPLGIASAVYRNTWIDYVVRSFSIAGIAMPSRSEGHTSELQSLMRISYAVFCLKKHNMQRLNNHNPPPHTQ